MRIGIHPVSEKQSKRNGPHAVDHYVPHIVTSGIIGRPIQPFHACITANGRAGGRIGSDNCFERLTWTIQKPLDIGC